MIELKRVNREHHYSGNIYAAAAITGADAGATSDVSATGPAAAAGAGASDGAISNGFRGVGSSMTGGCSSTLAGGLTSCFLNLKKSVTRVDIRRPTLIALASLSFLSSAWGKHQ